MDGIESGGCKRFRNILTGQAAASTETEVQKKTAAEMSTIYGGP